MSDNPPTQGREEREAMERTMHAFLPDRDAPWPNKSPYEVYQAGWLAHAAYPQQTEGEESSWATLVLELQASLTAAEQRAENAEQELDRVRADNNRLYRAFKEASDSTIALQRERDNLRFDAMLHVQEIPLEPAEQNSWLKHEVERLQRECERLRELAVKLCDCIDKEYGESGQSPSMDFVKIAANEVREALSPNQVQTTQIVNNDGQ